MYCTSTENLEGVLVIGIQKEFIRTFGAGGRFGRCSSYEPGQRHADVIPVAAVDPGRPSRR